MWWPIKPLKCVGYTCCGVYLLVTSFITRFTEHSQKHVSIPSFKFFTYSWESKLIYSRKISNTLKVKIRALLFIFFFLLFCRKNCKILRTHCLNLISFILARWIFFFSKDIFRKKNCIFLFLLIFVFEVFQRTCKPLLFFHWNMNNLIFKVHF